MKKIKMTKEDFFKKMHDGGENAFMMEMKPCNEIVDGKVFYFGNEDASVGLSLSEDGEVYYSYWTNDYTDDVEFIEE